MRNCSSSNIPVVRVSPVAAGPDTYSTSDSSLNKRIQTNRTVSENSPVSLSDNSGQSEVFKISPPKNNSFNRAQDEDYTTDFY